MTDTRVVPYFILFMFGSFGNKPIWLYCNQSDK